MYFVKRLAHLTLIEQETWDVHATVAGGACSLDMDLDTIDNVDRQLTTDPGKQAARSRTVPLAPKSRFRIVFWRIL